MDCKKIRSLLNGARKLDLATRHYPSRGQTAIQELYQTAQGKFFLKRVSKKNHSDCQISLSKGTLAERENWAFQLATFLKLRVPTLWLMDKMTTVQEWFDKPDGRTYTTSQASMKLDGDNIFDCALFDWITGQVDRHDANYLYDFVEEEIILIDSAHSFLKYDGSLPDYLKIVEIAYPKQLQRPRNTPVKTRLQLLNAKKINALVPLSDPEERISLERRLDRLKNMVSLQQILDLYRGKYG